MQDIRLTRKMSDIVYFFFGGDILGKKVEFAMKKFRGILTHCAIRVRAFGKADTSRRKSGVLLAV